MYHDTFKIAPWDVVELFWSPLLPLIGLEKSTVFLATQCPGRIQEKGRLHLVETHMETAETVRDQELIRSHLMGGLMIVEAPEIGLPHILIQDLKMILDTEKVQEEKDRLIVTQVYMMMFLQSQIILLTEDTTEIGLFHTEIEESLVLPV